MNRLDSSVKSLNAFLLIKSIAIVLFTIALVGFEATPTIGASATQYVSQAALQRTRSEIFVKSALVLAYRPIAEKTAAISDLQTVLPLFEQEQSVLLENTALDVQVLLSQARPDYLALDQAVRYILSNQAGNIDLTQVNIILAHEKGFLITMNTLILVLNQHAHSTLDQTFIMEMSISIVILLFMLVFIMIVRYMINGIALEIRGTLKPDKNVPVI